MKNRRDIQIGVMGSCSDMGYKKSVEVLATEIGKEIARRKAILVFGAERDEDSLSTAAARGAKENDGITVGVTYGKDKNTYETATITIATGLDRGGGREFVLSLSCDVLIAISGGSGTLTEIAVAYQANIPIVVLENTGGWSDKLSNTYIDKRKRVKIIGAKNAKDAVEKALNLVR